MRFVLHNFDYIDRYELIYDDYLHYRFVPNEFVEIVIG